MSITKFCKSNSVPIGLAVLDEIEKKKLVLKQKKKEKFLFKRLNDIKEKFSDIVSYVSGNGHLYMLLFLKMIKK